MAKKLQAPPVPYNPALAALGVPQEPGPDDPLVILPTGFVEDQRRFDGSVTEVQVHPPGAIVRRSVAQALHVDDAILAPAQVTSTEYISGPTLPVREAQLFED